MNDQQLRMQDAVTGAGHATAVPALAKALRDEGVKQIDLYALFSGFQQQCDPDDDRYDSIVDTMDLIHGGPWAKGWNLYPHELTQDEIDKIKR